MQLTALSRLIEAHFRCACDLGARREAGRCVLHVRYDTRQLPPTWQEFIDADAATCRAMEAFVRGLPDAGAYDRIEVEHVARSARTVWLPIGTDGVIAVSAAPDYFRRTGQDALYSPDLHGADTFKL